MIIYFGVEIMLELLSIIVLAIIVIGVLIKEYIREKKSNSKANNELNNIEQTNTKQYKNKEIVNNKNSENKKSTIDEFCNKHYKKIWIVFLIILFILRRIFIFIRVQKIISKLGKA